MKNWQVTQVTSYVWLKKATMLVYIWECLIININIILIVSLLLLVSRIIISINLYRKYLNVSLLYQKMWKILPLLSLHSTVLSEYQYRIIVFVLIYMQILWKLGNLNCKYYYISNRIDSDGNCDGVQIGERVDFDINMTLLQCTDDGMQLWEIH